MKISLQYLTYLAMLVFTNLALAGTVDEIISSCWKDHSHVEMSACVSNIAEKELSILKNQESTIRTWIKGKGEPQEYKSEMAKTFESSIQSFQKYRSNQCNFYAALTAGGNAANDLRLACEAELNSIRTEQLKSMQKRWP